LRLAHAPGPLGLLRGEADEDEIRKACGITVRYTKIKNTGTEVVYRRECENFERSMVVSPAREAEIKDLLISQSGRR
jgi:hypothetical protein